MADRTLTIRLDENIYERAKTAAVLKGMSTVSEYIVSLVEADLKATLGNHEPIVLGHEDFVNFIEACESSDGPNQKLIGARDVAR